MAVAYRSYSPATDPNIVATIFRSPPPVETYRITSEELHLAALRNIRILLSPVETVRLDVTSRVEAHSLLIPDGYVGGKAIMVRTQEDEDGSFLVTSHVLTMHGYGDSSESAFEDFRVSLKNHFLSLVRDKDILGVLPRRELEELSKIFVREDL